VQYPVSNENPRRSSCLDIQSSDVTLRVVILVDCRDPSQICLSVSLEVGGGFVPLF
jgi:hypothetical protein